MWFVRFDSKLLVDVAGQPFSLRKRESQRSWKSLFVWEWCEEKLLITSDDYNVFRASQSVEVGGMDRDLVGQGECLRRALACLESHHGESLLKLTVAADKINEAPLCLCSKSLQSVVFRQKSLLLHPTTKIGLGNWIE